MAFCLEPFQSSYRPEGFLTSGMLEPNRVISSAFSRLVIMLPARSLSSQSAWYSAAFVKTLSVSEPKSNRRIRCPGRYFVKKDRQTKACRITLFILCYDGGYFMTDSFSGKRFRNRNSYRTVLSAR